MPATRSVVVSMRLPEESGRRLKRLAKRHGWTASDASARLVEEGLRRSEFALIDFRDSVVGRQAYIQGSSLAIWEVMMIVRAYKGDAKKAADHLEWPEFRVKAAVHYAEAFPTEINEALAENEAMDFDALKKKLPGLELYQPLKGREKPRREPELCFRAKRRIEMLRLLLDEHLSPRIGIGLRRTNPMIEVHAISQWERGTFLGRADAELLAKAVAQGLTLVTYDCRTIPDLLIKWEEQGRPHGGVIFVDEKTLAPDDIGGLVRALASLSRDFGHLDWTDREMFLPRYR